MRKRKLLQKKQVMIELTNPRAAKLFEATVEKDRIVHVPGRYQGLLSNITVAGALKMVQDGDNQLVKKDSVSEDEVINSSEEEQSEQE